jgi:hypothetical protein
VYNIDKKGFLIGTLQILRELCLSNSFNVANYMVQAKIVIEIGYFEWLFFTAINNLSS